MLESCTTVILIIIIITMAIIKLLHVQTEFNYREIQELVDTKFEFGKKVY